METATQTSKPLPQYQCHKIVGAFKIEHIALNDRCNGWVIFGGGHKVEVSNDWMLKHDPNSREKRGGINGFIGGYYVVYPDGYVSFSPAKAFEEGYSLIG